MAERVLEMRRNGSLVPEVEFTNRDDDNRWQTEVRPLSNNRGFLFETKFDNTAKLTSYYLCSGVLFLDKNKYVIEVAGIRQHVDATFFGRTEIKRVTQTVEMPEEAVADVMFLEIRHERCPDTDFLKALEEAKRASEYFRAAAG